MKYVLDCQDNTDESYELLLAHLTEYFNGRA